MKRGQTHQKYGFTLVEILTAITVVAILLALLIPALSAVQDTAMKVKQRTQFHSIGVALETFLTDTGDYPPSAWNTATYGNYTASQRLAEAMVGRDGFGFHPDSLFRADGKGDIDGDGTLDPVAAGETIYDVVNGVALSGGGTQTAEQNVSARLGPYLELENANAVKLSSLYGSGNYGSLVDSFVLADQYKITKNLATGTMTGSPILYYRANTSKIGNDYTKISSNTYNILDALGNDPTPGDSIVDLVPLSTKTVAHPMSPSNPLGQNAGKEWFYDRIQNPNFSNPPRPYRAQSYILQSAGADGLYGTEDDVFNFDQDN